MAEIDRPTWCPFPECKCLSSYDNAMCSGRMPSKKQHDELFNTHRLCMGEDDYYEINDADAHYLVKLMQEVRKDVRCNNLYDPGRGDWYDLFDIEGPK